jgi:hypothetical protein
MCQNHFRNDLHCCNCFWAFCSSQVHPRGLVPGCRTHMTYDFYLANVGNIIYIYGVYLCKHIDYEYVCTIVYNIIIHRIYVCNSCTQMCIHAHPFTK